MAARRKYPWEKWFRQSRVSIRRGVDYQCSQSTMIQTIRNEASLRRISVRVDDTGDGVTFRVYRKGSREEGKTEEAGGDAANERQAPGYARCPTQTATAN